MEVFTSGPELPSRPSTPTFGPDNPLALVSLLLGQTGLQCRSQVVYEAGVEGNRLSEVRFSVLRNQGFQPHTSDHTSGDRKQAVCLANRKKTLQGETRVCRRQRPLAWKPEPGQSWKTSPLEPE